MSVDIMGWWSINQLLFSCATTYYCKLKSGAHTDVERLCSNGDDEYHKQVVWPRRHRRISRTVRPLTISYRRVSVPIT